MQHSITSALEKWILNHVTTEMLDDVAKCVLNTIVESKIICRLSEPGKDWPAVYDIIRLDIIWDLIHIKCLPFPAALSNIIMCIWYIITAYIIILLFLYPN